MLTAAEQAELAQLEKEVGGSGGLSPAEAAELAQLEAELGTKKFDKVVNEMHPDIDFTTRAVYKNFGADPEASFNYLQKKQPNLQWKKDKDGEVLAKRPDETEWRRLDPKGFDMQDVTDIGYDVPAAFAQGAATVASGLAGAPAGGIGAIPAAMAGSVASGAGLEGIRQGIGSMMGIENNLSGQDLAMAGVAGAVSPLMFGTGASGAAALKAAGKAGAKQTAQEILATQRGVLGRGYDAAAGYVGPKLANLAGGENTKVIKKAAGMLEELKAADKNTEVSALPLKEAAKQVPAKLREVTRQTGQRLNEIRDMIDNQPGLVLAGEGATKVQGTIDAKPFVEPFQDLILDLERKASSDSDRAAIEEIKQIVQDKFTGMPEFMTAAQVDGKLQSFKEFAEEYGKKYGNIGSTKSSSVSGVSGRVADAFESARKKMNESIIQRLEQMDPNLAEEYLGNKASYGKLMGMAEAHKNDFKNATNVKNFLNRAMNDPTDVAANQLEEIQKVTGIDLEELATRSQALKTFSKPETEIRSLAKSVTPRQLALGAATGTLGYYGAQQSGGDSPFLTAMIAGALGSKAASPAMLRKYMQMNAAVRSAPAKLPGYQALPYLMMNPDLHDQGEK